MRGRRTGFRDPGRGTPARHGEDTDTTFEELEQHFGSTIAGIVREVTDDKSLPKQDRKRLQIEHAAGASPQAKAVKLADKICNLRDIFAAPAERSSQEDGQGAPK